MKKNIFKYNFFEFILLNFFCCLRKNKILQRKQNLLENSNDFSDYFMDINFYIKSMMELDLIKKYLFTNDKSILNFINNFKPVLKEDYSESYSKKLTELYSNRISNIELESYLNSIKNNRLNEELLKDIKHFYE